MTSDSGQEKKLLQACAVLFGSHLTISPPFLDYIQLPGVKSAYRNRVRETHPDVLLNRQADPLPEYDFHMVRESYEQLCHFLDQRNVLPRPRPASVSPPGQRSTGSSAAHQPRSRHSSASQHGFSLPARPMLLGEFLHHSGYCGWHEIVQALAWQRRSRPRLGEIGCKFGWMEQQDIATIFRSLRGGIRFGETAIRLGLLSPQQVERMLRHQQIRQPKIGQFFLENDLLSPQQLQTALWHLSKHNFLVR
jgi:hypothetical protein